MKAYILQPPYSKDTAFSDEYFHYKLKLLDACGEDADIIVLPEYSDVPCVTVNLEETLFYHNKYIDILLSKCAETAKRCAANVFVNALSREETVKKAHEHGILCNVFWSDDPEETKKFREMGIDTILTNDYNLVSQAVKR